MTWSDIITRLRRYLRDPDGDIWADDDLLTYYNDAAIEVSYKSGFFNKLESFNFPPLYDYAYTYDWERDVYTGDGYQAFDYDQITGDVITYPWEAAYSATTVTTTDLSYRQTQPWEVIYGSPSDVIKILLPEETNKIKMVLWDKRALEPVTEEKLAASDGYYRTTIGYTQYYYHPDREHNQIVIYPFPSSTWLGSGTDKDPWDADDFTETEALVLIAESFPAALVDENSAPDIPAYLIKYVEYATLERAFGMDTDGYLPQMRDYWKFRKDVGIEAIKKWRRLALGPQKFRLGGTLPKSPVSRHPRLPADQYVDKY